MILNFDDAAALTPVPELPEESSEGEAPDQEPESNTVVNEISVYWDDTALLNALNQIKTVDTDLLTAFTEVKDTQEQLSEDIEVLRNSSANWAKIAASLAVSNAFLFCFLMFEIKRLIRGWIKGGRVRGHID